VVGAIHELPLLILSVGYANARNRTDTSGAGGFDGQMILHSILNKPALPTRKCQMGSIFTWRSLTRIYIK
jgi:hypothetical protein